MTDAPRTPGGEPPVGSPHAPGDEAGAAAAPLLPNAAPAAGAELPAVRAWLGLEPKAWALLAAFMVAFPADWLSKRWISSELAIDGSVRPVLDGFFYLSHVRNPGAALGLFADWPVELRRVGFASVAALAAWVVMLFYRGLAPGDRLNGVALGLVLGGGLGNLWDRLVRGEVIDFIHFKLWGPWSFPDFNLADVFILAGVGLLMIELLVSEGIARAEVIGRTHTGDVPRDR
jgi:signal peptidase II